MRCEHRHGPGQGGRVGGVLRFAAPTRASLRSIVRAENAAAEHGYGPHGDDGSRSLAPAPGSLGALAASTRRRRGWGMALVLSCTRLTATVAAAARWARGCPSGLWALLVVAVGRAETLSAGRGGGTSRDRAGAPGRRDQHHQLGPLGAIRLALEQRAEMAACSGTGSPTFVLRDVVRRRQRERLALRALDVGFLPSRRRTPDPKPCSVMPF